jgi:hypothetical protein
LLVVLGENLAEIASRITRSILAYGGPFPYIDGLIMQITRNIGQLQVRHLPRKRGYSNYTVQRRTRLFMAMALNFSIIPHRLKACGLLIRNQSLADRNGTTATANVRKI